LEKKKTAGKDNALDENTFKKTSSSDTESSSTVVLDEEFKDNNLRLMNTYS
jgi:hypothetical protein